MHAHSHSLACGNDLLTYCSLLVNQMPVGALTPTYILLIILENNSARGRHNWLGAVCVRVPTHNNSWLIQPTCLYTKSCCAGALIVACSHDSIPDDLLLHTNTTEPNSPMSPQPSPSMQSPGSSPEQLQPAQQQQEDNDGAPGRPDLRRSGSRHWELGPQGVSRLSSGHSLSRLSPGHRLSRLSPLR